MRVSPVFRCPPAVYVRGKAKRLLKRYLWLPALLTIVLIVASCFDIRFAYLLVMVLFVVYPMVLTFIWITITGQKHAVMATRPQRWTFGESAENALEVEYYRFDTDDSADAPAQAVDCKVYCADSIERIERSGSYTYVWLRHPKGALLAIPSEYTPSAAR